MAKPAAAELAPAGTWLRTVARFLPHQRGIFTRHLRVMRAGMAVVGKATACRDVDVVSVSATSSVRVHQPHTVADKVPAVLWVHGGGYVWGSAAVNDRAVRRMSERLGVLVASVEYRLAPEHPYPAALDDCFAALHWLATRDDIDHRRILVAGKSAGGGLAAALLLRWTDAGLTRIAGQVLIYPMLDDRSVQRSSVTAARGWPPEDNRFGWRAYLGSQPGENGVDTYAAPARRADLSGLPPTWIGVGTEDLFHEEAVDYAHRLRAAGVPTQLAVVPGAYHGFDVVGPHTNAARQFTANMLAAMRQMLM